MREKREKMGMRAESEIKKGEEEMKGGSKKTRVAENINKGCRFQRERPLLLCLFCLNVWLMSHITWQRLCSAMVV